MSLEKLYEIDEVAEYLGCSARQVRRFVAEGRLACARIGRRPVFRERDIEAFLDSPTLRKTLRKRRTQAVNDSPAVARLVHSNH